MADTTHNSNKKPGVHPHVRNFLRGAAGYSVGAAAGFLFIFLVSRLGIVRWLSALVDESQPLIRVLAVLVLAWLVISLGGAILGGFGGWALGSILGIPRKRRQVVGSAIAFGVTVGALSLIYMLLIGFIGVYNNFTANRIEHYGIVFGIFWLVFGFLTGIVHSFMSLRFRETWRVILAAAFGFMMGGILMGAMVRLVNPTAGFQTYPILTALVLIVALSLPFVFGGGALGFTYGRIAQHAGKTGTAAETLQPSTLQSGIVALIAVLLVIGVLSVIGNLKGFITMNPAEHQAQIPAVTTGVWWTEPRPAAADDGASFPTDVNDPAEATGSGNVQHQAWCSQQGSIQYRQNNGSVEQIDSPPCSSSPALALDLGGNPHLVWFTTEIADTNGTTRPGNLLVESIRTSQGWSRAAIVVETEGPATLSMSADEKGNLALVWKEADGSAFSTLQEFYSCDESELTPIEKAGLEKILAGDFRPPRARIPYCRNQYERIIYTPNPDVQYSSLPTTPNGAFDLVSTIADNSDYEVLFTTMQWEPKTSPPNPGNILAEAIASLYLAARENPERFPRGMTVRILLGNYPVISNMQWGSQIWDAISDLREAGVEKMVDPEIGWRLEIANYSGTYPHAHTKFIIVDGKRVSALGFNYGYLHFPKDHPSGLGYDLFDLGLLIRGPVAQDGIGAYDDMWEGADQIHCEDISLDNEDWQSSCTELKATADHVPEVLRTYLPPGGDSNSFSLYRTTVHREADEFLYAGLASAQQSIDAIEVNFSLEAVCMLNLVFPDFCTMENALPWMNALLESVETHQTRVRVIMENTNSNGLENRVAGEVFLAELKRRGLDDLVELRFYDGKVHAKSMLIDDQLLVIGSQNFHYSSWGDSSLAEYNVTSNDPLAIEEYKKMFEINWAEAIPFEESEYGASP